MTLLQSWVTAQAEVRPEAIALASPGLPPDPLPLGCVATAARL